MAGLLKMSRQGLDLRGQTSRLRHHRQRPQGPRHGHDHRAEMREVPADLAAVEEAMGLA